MSAEEGTNGPSPANFYSRIKSLVKKKNSTIEALLEDTFGSEAGVSRSAYNGWRTRGRFPSADKVYRLAKELGTSVEFLVAGETELRTRQRIELDNLLNRLTPDEVDRAAGIIKAAFPDVEHRGGGSLAGHESGHAEQYFMAAEEAPNYRVKPGSDPDSKGDQKVG